MNPRGPSFSEHITISLSKRLSQLPSLPWRPELISNRIKLVQVGEAASRDILDWVHRTAQVLCHLICTDARFQLQHVVWQASLSQVCGLHLGYWGSPCHSCWYGKFLPYQPPQIAGHCSIIYWKPSISFSHPVYVFCIKLLTQHAQGLRGWRPASGLSELEWSEASCRPGSHTSDGSATSKYIGLRREYIEWTRLSSFVDPRGLDIYSQKTHRVGLESGEGRWGFSPRSSREMATDWERHEGGESV